MIEILLKLLEITDSKDESIQILKGKYKIMTTFKDAKRQYKMEH